MHSRSFSSLPPRDGSSLANGECGRAQNDPSIIAYKKIVHRDDGNVEKKNQDDDTTTIICEEKKRLIIMMVTMSFGFITNCYKPSISFLLVAALGAAMVSFHSWVWLQLTTCLVLWMST